jgi:hypothetical protein
MGAKFYLYRPILLAIADQVVPHDSDSRLSGSSRQIYTRRRASSKVSQNPNNSESYT